jgi:hypothetical protein
MITVQEAVNSTLAYVKQFEGLMPSNNIRLEEFRYEDGPQYWFITLSFAEPPVGPHVVLSTAPPPRAFKTFTIDTTGQVVAMKIRNPLNP